MHDTKKPEIIVFAGPNGSGKSTITKMAKIIEPYINADDIKRTNLCEALEAAQIAERLRNECVDNNRSFTFETVLSCELVQISDFHLIFVPFWFIRACEYQNTRRLFNANGRFAYRQRTKRGGSDHTVAQNHLPYAC